MTQDVAIVEPVELTGLDAILERLETGHYVATTTPTPLEAVYRHRKRGHFATRPVRGFSRSGYPLVMTHQKLVAAHKAEAAIGIEFSYMEIREMENPPLSGPFTAPPVPLYAAFSDERDRRSVLFFDAHGRAVCHNEDGQLYLAVEDEEFVRVEFEQEAD